MRSRCIRYDRYVHLAHNFLLSDKPQEHNYPINTHGYISKSVTKRNPTIFVVHSLWAEIPWPENQLELRNCNIPWVFFIYNVIESFQPGEVFPLLPKRNYAWVNEFLKDTLKPIVNWDLPESSNPFSVLFYFRSLRLWVWDGWTVSLDFLWYKQISQMVSSWWTNRKFRDWTRWRPHFRFRQGS